MGRHLNTQGLHIGKLSTPGRTVGGGALDTAQGRGTAHDQNLACSPRDHGRQHRPAQARQGIDEGGEHLAPFDLVHVDSRGARIADGQVGDEDVHLARCGDQGRRGLRLQQRIGARDHRGTTSGEHLAQHGAHEGVGVGYQDAFAPEG